MLSILRVYKEGFNESIKIGESVEYAGDKYIVVRILELKKLYFSKSVRLEVKILVQKVGEITDYHKYKMNFAFTERYNQSKEDDTLRLANLAKIGNIIFSSDKKMAYEVISINHIHYEFVDLIVEYTAQMIIPWSKYEINKALRDERKSTFKVLEGEG
ncbi:hypothetical protein [Enterococcus sp. DIV0188]|uniref:hypothetical protein n=1 Tax=Enterococcus sp. DIV0188 TaxID=2774858 RepID=UPI003F21F065